MELTFCVDDSLKECTLISKQIAKRVRQSCLGNEMDP